MRSLVEIPHLPILIGVGKKFLILGRIVLLQVVNVFCDDNICPDDIAEAGHIVFDRLLW